jgi:methionine biosynthesis protein MetW
MYCRVTTPDNNSTGFLEHAPKAGRYENSSVDPDNVAAKISAFIPPNARVLDVGCGTGSVSELIQKITGAKLLGIEPDPARAAAASARGLTIIQGFLTENILQEHGPFDAIVFADVLEHMPNPAEMVILAKKGLAPRGAIIASVPNVAHWFVRTDLLRGRFDYQDCGIMDATHLRWFTRKTIKEFFVRCGFQVAGLSQTVNVDLPDYQRRVPWRWLRESRRRRVVGMLVKMFPDLFGCQYVVRAALTA